VLVDAEIIDRVGMDQDKIQLLRLETISLPHDLLEFTDVLSREMCLDPFCGAKVVSLCSGACHMLLH